MTVAADIDGAIVSRSLRQVGVPRAAARVMAACAEASELCPQLRLDDALARSAFERLGGDRNHFSDTDLRCTAFRTFVVDCLARDFFTRSPQGLGVGVWSLLGTRAHRLHEFPWVDVDSPEIADLRRFVLPPRRGWLQLGTCLCRGSWLDAVCGRSKRKLLLVLDESVLPVAGGSLMRFLDDISARLTPGSELVLAFDANAPLRPAMPLRRGPALELVLTNDDGAPQIVRYPRLRFIDTDTYPAEVATSVDGVNAVASLYGGVGAPALAHLSVI